MPSSCLVRHSGNSTWKHRKAELFTPEPHPVCRQQGTQPGGGMPKSRRKRAFGAEVGQAGGFRETVKGEVTHRTVVSALGFVVVSTCVVKGKQSSQ